MENHRENLGKTEKKTALIPGSLSAASLIPTSYATFSTDCENARPHHTLHLGFMIEFSPYQQA